MNRLPILIAVVHLIFVLHTHAWESNLFIRRRIFGDGRTDSEPSEYEKWFTQNLDHFNQNDERTWQQRYYMNSDYSDGKGNLAFLMIGGEGEETDSWMTNGSWITYAGKYKPILFDLEHRYYGKSHPTEDLSTENLVYLTSQQALADIAFFIEAMNEQHNLTDNVKWIVFGGSYPGNLAAWVRQKYPHLVHGAVSSSAPLLAKLNFSEYYNVVVDSLRASNDNCPTIIKESFSQVEALLLTEDGQRNLNKLFNLCGDITENVNNSLDMSTFFLRLSSQFAEAAQYNENNSLDTLCNIMLNESIGPEINRLAAVYNSTYIENYCFNYNYDTMIEGPRNISWSSHDRSSRAWTYQTCTEFGYFQTTSKFPLSYWIQICQDIFSPSYTETFLNHAIKNTNVEYGGLDIQVSNVVFVHGSLDPWHALGITTTLNEKVPAILINGTAHCGDMRNPSDDDSPQLKAARVKVEELIGTWIDL